MLSFATPHAKPAAGQSLERPRIRADRSFKIHQSDGRGLQNQYREAIQWQRIPQYLAENLFVQVQTPKQRSFHIKDKGELTGRRCAKKPSRLCRISSVAAPPYQSKAGATTRGPRPTVARLLIHNQGCLYSKLLATTITVITWRMEQQ